MYLAEGSAYNILPLDSVEELILDSSPYQSIGSSWLSNTSVLHYNGTSSSNTLSLIINLTEPLIYNQRKTFYFINDSLSPIDLIITNGSTGNSTVFNPTQNFGTLSVNSVVCFTVIAIMLSGISCIIPEYFSASLVPPPPVDGFTNIVSTDNTLNIAITGVVGQPIDGMISSDGTFSINIVQGDTEYITVINFTDGSFSESSS